jgi:hypothetical protein
MGPGWTPHLEAMHQRDITHALRRLGHEQLEEGLNRGPQYLARFGIRVGCYGFKENLVSRHQRFDPALHDSLDEVGFGIEVIAERANGWTRRGLDRSQRDGAHAVRGVELFSTVEEGG